MAAVVGETAAARYRRRAILVAQTDNPKLYIRCNVTPSWERVTSTTVAADDGGVEASSPRRRTL